MRKCSAKLNLKDDLESSGAIAVFATRQDLWSNFELKEEITAHQVEIGLRDMPPQRRRAVAFLITNKVHYAPS